MKFIEFLIEKQNFKQLKQNQVKLTDEEHAEAMAKKATWYHGPGGAESSAIWKSVDKDGKITYVTHTHRAMNTATTLKGIIGKYHSFIKGTS